MRALSLGIIASLSFLIPRSPSGTIELGRDEGPKVTYADGRASVIPSFLQDEAEGEVLQSCVLCPTNVLLCFFQLGTSGHVASSAHSGSHANPHEFCLADPPTGSPCSGHPFCFALADHAKAERLQHLIDLAAGGGMDAARQIVSEFPDRVEVVPERQSLLVESCGRVVGFFPVDALVLAEAAAGLPSRETRVVSQYE